MLGKKGKPEGKRPESGNPEEVDDGARGKGGEGARNAEVTPPLAPSGEPGQTSHAAPADDVGVPPDEEMARDTSE